MIEEFTPKGMEPFLLNDPEILVDTQYEFMSGIKQQLKFNGTDNNANVSL
jgi:hypothetical protein